MSAMENNFLSTSEVADMLHMSARSIRRYIETGELVAIRLNSKILIDPKDLKSFIESRKTGADQ